MHKQNEIRVLALGLIRDGNRVFISQGYDMIHKHRKLFTVLWVVE
jgi:hypothetical protein